MRWLAPAKINITLDVLGPRPDGYHELKTVFQAISLCDELAVDLAPDLDVKSPFPPGEDLVARAARALSARFAVSKGARIVVTKHIPVGAGLGGGSSDAAACLLALSELWDVRVGTGALEEIARGLGADVPFFLRGGTALGTGRGDEIRPLPFMGRREVLLVKPQAALSTAQVFAGARPGGQRFTECFLAGEGGGAPGNDLWPEAARLLPELGPLKEDLMRAGAAFVALSGTGPTLWTFGRPKLAPAWAQVAADWGCFFAAVHTLEEIPRFRPNIAGNNVSSGLRREE